MFGRVGQRSGGGKVCEFFLQGRCKFGDSCKFEHPSSQNSNRFSALSNPPTSTSRTGANMKDPPNYGVTKDLIVGDLKEERPIWPFSAYGPGKEAPRQLFGGLPIEQSPEEMRLMFYQAQASGNSQPAVQAEQQLYQQMKEQIEKILKDPDGAVKYVLDGDNEHPNRRDLVVKPGQSNPFSQQQSSSGTTSAFGQPSNIGQSAFGQPSQSQGASAFGQSSQLGTSTAFGQASQPGTSSAFGQPSQPGSTSAFGQSSQSGNASAFGQPSQAGATSAFGQQSQTTGASAFGQPSQPGSISAFGQPSQPGSTSAFGQASQLGGSSAFGQASQPGGSSAFGQPSQMGKALNPSAPAFGQASQPANPFQVLQNTPASPFGQQAQNNSSPFAAAAQAQTSTFGTPSNANQSSGAFGQNSQTSPSPFGQQQSHSQNQANTSAIKSPSMSHAHPPAPPGDTAGTATPPVSSYAQLANGQLQSWRGSPVKYVDGAPYFSKTGNLQDESSLERVWLPEGPPGPNIYMSEDAEMYSKYGSEVEAAYKHCAEQGTFEGQVPLLAPLRAWTRFDI